MTLRGVEPRRRTASRAARVALFAALHTRGFATIRRVKKQGLTFLDFEALADLYLAVSRIERLRIPGVILEAGCAAGGSAIVIGAAKRRERRFCTHDVFGLIPPPSAKDGLDVRERYEEILRGKATGPRGTTYYGYQKDLLNQVKRNFYINRLDPEKLSIQFIQGLYEDTLHVEDPVALAHIDCDWYDSVMTCLQRIVPKLQVGGALIIDDYFAWSGCRAAVDDFFQGNEDEFRFVPKARLHISRVR